MIESDVEVLEPGRFREVVDPRQWAGFRSSLDRASAALRGRTVWHVNSSMTGGGVAELLSSIVGYLAGAGIRSRWMVLQGTDEFFVLTKRIHHMLHGKEGDGGPLGPAEAALYDSVLAEECDDMLSAVDRGDLVVLHDPQVAGLAPALRDLGTHVIWNCHVGSDSPNRFAWLASDFLLGWVSKAHAQVFSRRQYVWAGLDPHAVAIIPPCIDAFAPKNQFLDSACVRTILATTGLVDEPAGGDAVYLRQDGSSGTVRSRTEMLGAGPVPPDVPIVTQVSRWDPLKDHAGVALGFAREVPPSLGAHLVLAGPSPEAVADDPEGAATLAELRACVDGLVADGDDRIHIACLPMTDVEENATIVNALQRRARVVVQKSLAEGFGLTVAEAMWKERPVVASAVGGIRDQIEAGETGVLIDDPHDVGAMGAAVASLLRDPRLGEEIGRNANRSVTERFLAPSYLCRYLSLVERVREQ